MKKNYNVITDITRQSGSETIVGTSGTDKYQILGVNWGIWHMPAFLLSGTQQSEWSFVPFFIGCIALSVIVTQLFNRSNGSILLTALIHFIIDT